jgi:tRNA(Ile)-lysidine synthase
MKRPMKHPWTSLHATVHQTLRDRNLLPKRSKILIALSGGQDSLCLTQLLLDLQHLWDWQLGIIHCDHRWRSDSAENATHVRTLAQTWNLPYHEAIAETDISTEAKARAWRYEQFVTIATQSQYHQVVTGHTRSDRAETLLYNLVRGSGTTGLQSLQWRRSLSPHLEVVRPLLDIARSQTGDFCKTRSLPIWEDSTNDDLHFDRNRIRQQILPLLAEHLNPQAEQHLAQTAEILQAEVNYLQTALEAVYDAIVQQDAIGQFQIHRPAAAALHLALQRRLIQKFCQDTKRFNPTLSQVESLVRLLTAPNRSQSSTLPYGNFAVVAGEWLVWHRN